MNQDDNISYSVKKSYDDILNDKTMCLDDCNDDCNNNGIFKLNCVLVEFKNLDPYFYHMEEYVPIPNTVPWSDLVGLKVNIRFEFMPPEFQSPYQWGQAVKVLYWELCTD